MAKETELSAMWYDAVRLRQEGKALTANGGASLCDVLEERLFEEADKRIDQAIARKRAKPWKPPEWERDWEETEVILFESGVRRNDR